MLRGNAIPCKVIKNIYNYIKRGVETMKLVEKLDLLMKEKGINKKDLSRQSGIPYTTIVNFYEKGTDNAKLSTLLKLSRYFKVTLDYIVEDSEERRERRHSPIGTRKSDHLITLWRQLPHKAQQEMLLKIEAKLVECATSEDGSIKSAQG